MPKINPSFTVVEEGQECPPEIKSHEIKSHDGIALPPQMEGCPDARELREFLMNFQAIEDATVRQQVMDAVAQAASEET